MSKSKPLVVRTPDKLPEESYREVLDRAKAGDRSVLPQVRTLLDKFPSLVDELGDLDRFARNAMLGLLDGDDLLTREAEERKLVALVEDVAGHHPTVLESLLAEQIVLCWQHIRYVEIKCALARDYTFREGEYFQRCLDRAQRRYLSAIKTLAQIRKLGLPALQVNIAAEGGKQVNVA